MTQSRIPVAIGLALAFLCGLVGAATKSPLALTVGLGVALLSARYFGWPTRIVAGLVFVMAGIGFGALPVLNPFDFVEGDFHSEVVVVERVALDDPIVVHSHSDADRRRLFVSNSSERQARFATLRAGDHVRAWFIRENGYLWQLEHRGDVLVSVEERNVERQAEAGWIFYPAGALLAAIGVAVSLYCVFR